MPDRISQMAEKQESEQNDGSAPRVSDWEFVSLTASTFQAAPGPQNPSEKTKLDSSAKKPKLDSSSYGEKYADFESPSSLFMSRHFLLPKEKELDTSSPTFELDSSSEKFELDRSSEKFEMDSSSKYGGKELEASSESKMKETDELQRSLSLSRFEERENVEERESVGTEERESGGTEERESEGEGVERESGESWWNKQIVSLYRRASERKRGFSVWKVFITAALIGVAIIGQRWKREKVQFQQMKLHFLVNNERISCMVGPFDQYKRISVGTNQNYNLVRDYSTFG